MSQELDQDDIGASDPRAKVRRRAKLLRSWLNLRLDPGQQTWLDEQLQRITVQQEGRTLAIAIGLAPRRVGKAELALDKAERTDAENLVPRLDTSGWSVDQAARILLVLTSFGDDEAGFVNSLTALLRSAEIGEQIALLRGLPLYPAPQPLLALAGEGIRSAVQPVFEAVAHKSPYPASNFGEAMWNQMIVKALFVGSKLAPIQGIDERRNPDLARMLVDYAHERWAAHRDVTPELWRCVGPFASGTYFPDLIKTFRWGGSRERKAAALALAECPDPEALKALEDAPTIWRDIRTGQLTWDQIA